MSKKHFFEEIKFDNYEYALDVKKDAEQRMENANKVFKLSVIGSIFGFLGPIFGPLMLAALIIGIICYKEIGGFKTALHWGWKAAQIGWFIVPIFPIDIIVGFVFLIGIPYYLLFMPAIIVYVFKRQAQNEIKEADKYLSYCKQVATPEN